jgi:hypothetical protein
MGAQNDELREGIERAVGVLPDAYTAFLANRESTGFTWHFRGLDGGAWEIVFFDLSDVAEQIPKSPVRADQGLLVIGRMNADQYVLDVRSGAVWAWNPRCPWEADRDSLLLIDQGIGPFVKRLWKVLPDGRDHALHTLATAGDLEAVEHFLAANPVDRRNIPGGGTLAERAAGAGRVPIVERCIDAGCSTGRLVAFAVRGGDLPTVRALVEELGLSPDDAYREMVLTSPEVRTYLNALRLSRARL